MYMSEEYEEVEVEESVENSPEKLLTGISNAFKSEGIDPITFLNNFMKVATFARLHRKHGLKAFFL